MDCLHFIFRCRWDVTDFLAFQYTCIITIQYDTGMYVYVIYRYTNRQKRNCCELSATIISMAGNKRSWEGTLVQKETAVSDVEMASESSDHQPSTQSMFTFFRTELDEHHDRRERIIKASRDITALSKKMYAYLLGSNLI